MERYSESVSAAPGGRVAVVKVDAAGVRQVEVSMEYGVWSMECGEFR